MTSESSSPTVVGGGSKWLLIPLGDVVHHRKEFILIDDTQTYKRCRVQLHVQGIVLRDTVPGAEIKTKKQQICRTDEFLVAEIDAKVGGFGIVPPDLDGAIVSSHYFLFVVDKSRLDPRFLGYFIRTPTFQEQVKAQGSTNYAAIRPEHILGYRIPLPPLPEQRRIVDWIEQLSQKMMEALAISKAWNNEIDALTSRVFSETFDSLTSKVLLSSVCQTSSGGTPSRDRVDFYEGELPWVKSGELNEGVILSSEEHISELAVRESSTKLFPKGTLLIALYGATVGKTALLGIDAATNQAVCALFPDSRLDRDYLWCFLRRIKPVLIAASFGGAQPNISQRLLRDTEIPLPPIEEQRRIVSFLAGLQVKIDAIKQIQSQTAAELDALLPSILDKAFKGEL